MSVAPSFEVQYAESYDVSVEDATARLDLIRALRPHLPALKSIGRQRYAMLIDASAAEDVGRRKALQLTGAAKEALAFADTFEQHCSLVDQLQDEYTERLREVAKETV